MNTKTLGNRQYLLIVAWSVTLTGLLTSLFFSEVMKLPPCSLCWYQRVFMFPLVITFAVGILRRDEGVDWYAWPLIFLGAAFSLYHNLLYYGVIPEGLVPCAQGIPCTSRQMEWFGFLSIPLLSLLAFLLVAGLLLAFNLTRRSN